MLDHPGQEEGRLVAVCSGSGRHWGPSPLSRVNCPIPTAKVVRGLPSAAEKKCGASELLARSSSRSSFIRVSLSSGGCPSALASLPFTAADRMAQKQLVRSLSLAVVK